MAQNGVGDRRVDCRVIYVRQIRVNFRVKFDFGIRFRSVIYLQYKYYVI